MALKNFMENPESNGAKTDLICVEKSIAEGSLIGEQVSKHKFASKPKYFICFVIIFIIQKGNIIVDIEGIDFPKLYQYITKNFSLLDE